MKATFFQSIKLCFALMGFVGILVGYRGSDYPIQANPSPFFRPTPVLLSSPEPRPLQDWNSSSVEASSRSSTGPSDIDVTTI